MTATTVQTDVPLITETIYGLSEKGREIVLKYRADGVTTNPYASMSQDPETGTRVILLTILVGHPYPNNGKTRMRYDIYFALGDEACHPVTKYMVERLNEKRGDNPPRDNLRRPVGHSVPYEYWAPVYLAMCRLLLDEGYREAVARCR